MDSKPKLFLSKQECKDFLALSSQPCAEVRFLIDSSSCSNKKSFKLQSRIFGVRMSEPHTSEFNGGISIYIYTYTYCTSYVQCTHKCATCGQYPCDLLIQIYLEKGTVMHVDYLVAMHTLSNYSQCGLEKLSHAQNQ